MQKAISQFDLLKFFLRVAWEVKAIDNKKLVKALFCGETECEDYIKDTTGGATSRCIPFSQKLVTGKCVHCGKQAKFMVYWGKSY